jgi:uncharacterized protein (DUF362 family)/NAD-dependent dihydropyrimidine dehydrogenase PreA subunit
MENEVSLSVKVVIKKQAEYILTEVSKAVKQIFAELKIEEKLKDKKLILLKPNLLGAFSPDRAVTTHPVVLEAVILALKGLGKDIVVGDSPGGTVKTQQVWQVTGLAEVCERQNVPLLDFGKDGVVDLQTEVGKLYFAKNVFECDAIINLAKMKTHSMTLYTGAVKNLYGTIPGLFKSELHKEFPNPKDFAKVLTTIYNLLKDKITLNIIDGIVGMEGAGPSAGDPFPFKVLIASTQATAADYVATQMMGFDFPKIIYLQQCFLDDNLREKDIIISGNFQYKNIKINTVTLRNTILQNMPGFIKNVLKKIFVYYPAFLPECKLCGVCIESCPVKALSIVNKAITLDKTRCIRCMCCHEMCPHSMVYLRRKLLARVIFRR